MFHPDDEDAEHPLLGRCDPVYDEKTEEFRDYYCDEEIAEVEHRHSSHGAVTTFICHAPNDISALLALVTGGGDAVEDIIAERRRQIEVEGWSPEHDDEHNHNELSRAAACYALGRSTLKGVDSESLWPGRWSLEWWKPTTHRRNLVKAAALIIAEIERIDRLEWSSKQPPVTK